MSETVSPTPAVTSAAGAEAAPPLDDVMLAMDVVDTLRRRERLVMRELDEVGREDDLKERLRRIYAQQGIDVPDHVIEQGVAALKEDRFTYKSPKEGLGTKLARAYISRGKWGKWVAGFFGAGVVATAANYFAFLAPNSALQADLAEVHTELVVAAKSDTARSAIEQAYNAGNLAFQAENYDGAKEALNQLEDIRTTLQQDYTIRVANREGERSGVWRIPDINENARNYYVIVEAIDASGKTLTVPIRSEETGKTARVKAWGLRVDEATYLAVGEDKKDNGIIENDRFGYKKAGYLEPQYEMPTLGGAITSW